MALLSTVSRLNWNLEMLVFVEGGKIEYPEKNPQSRDENQQQTQPTYETENQTWAALVGGECTPLHHPCSLVQKLMCERVNGKWMNLLEEPLHMNTTPTPAISKKGTTCNYNYNIIWNELGSLCCGSSFCSCYISTDFKFPNLLLHY